MNGMTASAGRAVVVGTMGTEALTALYDLRCLTGRTWRQMRLER